ncbi:MAG: DegV family protein [Clostridia bacterium]|nr:DegV family protein [Clostridia bacterium]
MEAKMKNFDIYVDSAANLTDEMIKENEIKVISYTCLIDGKEINCYEDGVPFAETAKKFYAAMREGADTKTTLVNADKIMTAVTPSLEAGRDALIITIAEGISGTYNQAVEAAKELGKKFPERKILVSQSANASLGEGLVALYAARLAADGKDIETCHKWIESNKFNIHGVCTVDSLKYLKRGGRVSTALAIAGTILNIKPVLHGDENSKLTVFCNERGRKKSIARLIETFKENVIDPENQTVAIAHADCEEDALELAERIKALGAKDIVMNYYDLCTGAHAGPGTIALFFTGKSRLIAAEKTAGAKVGVKAKQS